MADEQNQNEEEKRKNQSYQDLVMQQDPILEGENAQVTKTNDQKKRDESQGFTQEVRTVIKEEKREKKASQQEAIQGVRQIQETRQVTQQKTGQNTQKISELRGQDIKQKQIAAGKIKLIEGIGMMAADRLQDIESMGLEQAAQEQIKNTEAQEAQGVATAIEQQIQQKAREQLQRQQQIQAVQQQRKEAAQKQQQLDALKKVKPKEGFLKKLFKREANPASPSKTLNRGLPGLGLITKYFEMIIP